MIHLESEKLFGRSQTTVTESYILNRIWTKLIRYKESLL